MRVHKLNNVTTALKLLEKNRVGVLLLFLALSLRLYYTFICPIFLVEELTLNVYDPPKVKLVGISNYDIVDGKSTPILGLIWSIILRFQVIYLASLTSNDGRLA